MKESHLISMIVFVWSTMLVTLVANGCLNVSNGQTPPSPPPDFVAVSDGWATMGLPSEPGVTNVSESPYDKGGTSVLTHLPGATDRFPIGQYYVDIPEGGTARIWFDSPFSMAELLADVREGAGVEMTMKLFADVPGGAVGTPSNISQVFNLKSGRNLVRLTPPEGFFDEPNGAPVAEVSAGRGGPVKMILTTTPSAKLLEPQINDGGGVAGDAESDEQ